jgi:hypothetical protein
MDQQMWRRIAQSAAARRDGRDYHRGSSPDGTWIAQAESGEAHKMQREHYEDVVCNIC